MKVSTLISSLTLVASCYLIAPVQATYGHSYTPKPIDDGYCEGLSGSQGHICKAYCETLSCHEGDASKHHYKKKWLCKWKQKKWDWLTHGKETLPCLKKPAVQIKKTIDGEGVNQTGESTYEIPAGNTYSYHFTMTNIGEVPLLGLNLTDDQLQDVSCVDDRLALSSNASEAKISCGDFDIDTPVQPGETVECWSCKIQAGGILSLRDEPVFEIKNTATVTAANALNPTDVVSDDDMATLLILEPSEPCCGNGVLEGDEQCEVSQNALNNPRDLLFSAADSIGVIVDPKPIPVPNDCALAELPEGCSTDCRIQCDDVEPAVCPCIDAWEQQYSGEGAFKGTPPLSTHFVEGSEVINISSSSSTFQDSPSSCTVQDGGIDYGDPIAGASVGNRDFVYEMIPETPNLYGCRAEAKYSGIFNHPTFPDTIVISGGKGVLQATPQEVEACRLYLQERCVEPPAPVACPCWTQDQLNDFEAISGMTRPQHSPLTISNFGSNVCNNDNGPLECKNGLYLAASGFSVNILGGPPPVHENDDLYSLEAYVFTTDDVSEASNLQTCRYFELDKELEKEGELEIRGLTDAQFSACMTDVQKFLE